MFERFTERARQVMVLAQEEARILHHGSIDPWHILVGVTREDESLGARVLSDCGITTDRLRADSHIDLRDDQVSGQIPFTESGKRVCELALRDALSLGHNYIGTEHLLLGLARVGDTNVDRILEPLDIRAQVLTKLGSPVLKVVRSKENPKVAPLPDDLVQQIIDLLDTALRIADDLTSLLHAKLREDAM